MFTEYHLDRIIQAINDAEERQTQALKEMFSIEKLAKAIKEAKGGQTVITAEKPEIKPIFHSAPSKGTPWQTEFSKSDFVTPSVPARKAPDKKATTTKKPTRSKK